MICGDGGRGIAGCAIDSLTVISWGRDRGRGRGKVLMPVTRAPHLMSTEYCLAAFSNISVIDEDLH